jgi:hypothetical protein
MAISRTFAAPYVQPQPDSTLAIPVLGNERVQLCQAILRLITTQTALSYAIT